MKSGECSLPEILGCLELTKINAERQAFTHAQTEAGAQKPRILKSTTLPPKPPNAG